MIEQRSTPVSPFAREFLLRPNRSMSARGLAVFFTGLATVAGVVSMVSAGQGNWFAPAFAAAELAVVGLCLRLAWRRSGRCERIALSDAAVLVEREPGATRFDPYWVRVERHAGTWPGEAHLVLTSHGRVVEIGAFLAENEREALERELKRALAALKAPGEAHTDTERR